MRLSITFNDIVEGFSINVIKNGKSSRIDEIKREMLKMSKKGDVILRRIVKQMWAKTGNN